MKEKVKRLLTGAQQAVGGESKRTFDFATAIAFKHFERIDTISLLLALLGAFTAQIRGWYRRNVALLFHRSPALERGLVQ